MTASSAAPPNATVSTTASPSIPFRPETTSAADGAIHALLATSLLLAACLGALLYAKKRGWLNKWIPAPNASGREAALRTTGVLRLSQKTSVYQVTDGQHEFLVVETAGAAQVVVLPKEGTDGRE